MKLWVIVSPGARVEQVEQVGSHHFVVKVKAPAQEGKANIAATKALAQHLKIAPSRLVLIKGAHSRQKVFELQ